MKLNGKSQVMLKCSFRTKIVAVALALCLCPGLTSLVLVVKTKAAKATAMPPAPTSEVFELEELSVFDNDTAPVLGLGGGPSAWIFDSEPNNKVRSYPKFKSEKPLYGKTTFDKSLVRYGCGIDYYFAVDESAGTGKGYDRLYFDANHDLDLTNDGVLLPMKEPPVRLIRENGLRKKGVAFEYLEFNLDRGPHKPSAPIKVIPLYGKLLLLGPHVSFVPPTVRKGKIKLGSEELEAVLSQSFTITGSYASPMTWLDLGKESHSLPLLCGWHDDDGTFYTFSSTVSGDKLTVTPYTGANGILKVGIGGRNTREGKIQKGYLVREDVIINVDRCPTVDGRLIVPVGDYKPVALFLYYGDLRVGLGLTTPDAGEPPAEPPEFAIRIRKDRPFVLNFGSEPKMIFTTPAINSRFKVGSKIEVFAEVHDTTIGASIASLEDATQKPGMPVDIRDQEFPLFPIIEPGVQITNSSDELVAWGNMPFRRSDPHRYSWRVPKDLKLSANEEIFTIRVVCYTKGLYGKVSATREITICRD